MWKQCTKCGKYKALYFFYNRPGGLLGVRADCKECTDKRTKAYYRKNIKDRKKYNAEYYQDNKKHLNQMSQKWYQDNKEEECEKKRQDYQKNPDKYAEKNSSYRKNNPDIIKYHQRKYRNSKFNAEGSYTEEEWELLKKLSGYRCLRCGELVKLTRDHIIPLSEGGTDYIDNIQPLCQSCNSIKHTKFTDYRPPELIELILEH